MVVVVERRRWRGRTRGELETSVFFERRRIERDAIAESLEFGPIDRSLLGRAGVGGTEGREEDRTGNNSDPVQYLTVSNEI